MLQITLQRPFFSVGKHTALEARINDPTVRGLILCSGKHNFVVVLMRLIICIRSSLCRKAIQGNPSTLLRRKSRQRGNCRKRRGRDLSACIETEVNTEAIQTIKNNCLIEEVEEEKSEANSSAGRCICLCFSTQKA